jgi:hypothetical protein
VNIVGLRDLRLLAIQPVALLPFGGMDTGHRRQHFIELTFDSGVVMNVPITQKIHDEYLQRMREQGTSVEQGVSARREMPPLTTPTAPKEHPVRVDGPVDLEAEIRKALSLEPEEKNMDRVHLAPRTNDIAASKLYERMEISTPKDRDWVPITWGDLPEDRKEYYRQLAQVVQDNSPAPVDGEIFVKLPGVQGGIPIHHVFRCDVTEASINAACFDLRTWLLEITKNLR